MDSKTFHPYFICSILITVPTPKIEQYSPFILCRLNFAFLTYEMQYQDYYFQLSGGQLLLCVVANHAKTCVLVCVAPMHDNAPALCVVLFIVSDISPYCTAEYNAPQHTSTHIPCVVVHCVILKKGHAHFSFIEVYLQSYC